MPSRPRRRIVDAVTDATSTGWGVLDTALRVLATVASDISDKNWTQPTPCGDWNVTQLFQHAVGDQLAWASAITVGPPPAEDPFTPSGQLHDTPAAMLDQARAAAVQAWQGVEPGTVKVPTPLPLGSLPAAVAAAACALDAGVHAWDLAMATGQESPLTNELAAELHAAATQVVEPLRGFAYEPALLPEDSDDTVAALLRYLGRRPDWKAAD
jgi:uncharacterized protein (TIGR03086 family)